jgi:glycosyltransferase involved in cell wall biosynthesis
VTADNPQLSFVITGHNVAGSVRESVLSALGQDEVETEVVYVDDGSTDATLAVLEEIRDDRLKVVRLPRVGRVAALNGGVAHAAATLIAILDADDVALPGRAAAQIKFLDSRPDICVVGGQLEPVDSTGRVDRSGRLTFPTAPEEIDSWLCRGRMPLAHPAMTYRRDWFDRTGGYDASVLRAEDFDLVLRGWTRGSYAALPQIVTRYCTPLFPSWRYWRREQTFSRAVYRRWTRGDSAPLEIKSRPLEVAYDALEWIAQRVQTWTLNKLSTR